MIERIPEVLFVLVCTFCVAGCSEHKDIEVRDAAFGDADADEDHDVDLDRVHDADEGDQDQDVDEEIAPEAECGNGAIEAGEDCEGTDLNGASCVSVGFAGGALGCHECTFDTSGCSMSCDATGLIRAGDFSDAEQWTMTGSAFVDVTEEGASNPGVGVFPLFPLSDHCLPDEISQIVAMPGIDVCGPARLSRWITRDDWFVELQTAMNESWVSSAGGSAEEWGTWHEATDCLGDAAYGTEFRLGFRSLHHDCSCDWSFHGEALWIDQVSIEFDPTCPGIGEVVNGDFEGGGRGDWETGPPRRETSEATAEVNVPGIGVDGSRAGRLTVTNGCGDPWMRTQVSVPTINTLHSPALRFQAHLTPGVDAFFWLGHLRWMRIEGSDSFETRTFCLPRTLAGAVHGLSFSLWETGECYDDADPVEFIIDEVEIVDEPACTFESGLLDPGFEMTVGASSTWHGWYVERNSCYGEAAVEFVSDPLAAHSGHGAARFVFDNEDSCGLSHWFVVPPVTERGGPALTFWSRLTGPTPELELMVRVGVDFEYERGSVVSQGDYQRNLVCLPPLRSGAPIKMRIDSGWPDLDEGTQIWVDDFGLTTDESCPVESE